MHCITTFSSLFCKFEIVFYSNPRKYSYEKSDKLVMKYLHVFDIGIQTYINFVTIRNTNTMEKCKSNTKNSIILQFTFYVIY